MKKKIVKVVGAIAVSLALLVAMAGCTPANNRAYALNTMRNAGLSSRAVKFFDCVGYRESRWRENVVSPTNDRGLFQINAIHAGQFRQVTGKNYYTHAIRRKENVQYTIWLFRKAGASPWRGHTCRY